MANHPTPDCKLVFFNGELQLNTAKPVLAAIKTALDFPTSAPQAQRLNDLEAFQRRCAQLHDTDARLAQLQKEHSNCALLTALRCSLRVVANDCAQYAETPLPFNTDETGELGELAMEQTLALYSPEMMGAPLDDSMFTDTLFRSAYASIDYALAPSQTPLDEEKLQRRITLATKLFPTEPYFTLVGLVVGLSTMTAPLSDMLKLVTLIKQEKLTCHETAVLPSLVTLARNTHKDAICEQEATAGLLILLLDFYPLAVNPTRALLPKLCRVSARLESDDAFRLTWPIAIFLLASRPRTLTWLLELCENPRLNQALDALEQLGHKDPPELARLSLTYAQLIINETPFNRSATALH